MDHKAFSPWQMGSLRAFALWFLLALALALVAGWIPARLRGMAEPVLVEAGRGTVQADARIQDLLLLEQVAPASLLRDATTRTPTAAEVLAAERLLEERPTYRTSGGPAPYFSEFLRLAYTEKGLDLPETTIQAVLPLEATRILESFLTFSTRENVQRVLDAQDATGWQFFLPPNSAAGRPLKASLLLLALAVQSEAADADLSAELGRMAHRALEGDPTAMAELEQAALGTLTFARRWPWLPVAHIFRASNEAATIGRLAALGREEPHRLPLLYGGIALGADGESLADYLEEHGLEGWETLATSIRLGQGAVRLALDRNEAITRSLPGFRFLGESTPALLAQLALDYPRPALVVRLFLLFLAGVAVVRALLHLTHFWVGRVSIDAASWPSHAMQSLIGLGLGAGVLFLLEPSLLEPTPDKPEPFRLRIRAWENIVEATAQTFENGLMDRITIIVLAFFLVFQIVIYLLGLLKVQEIRKRTASPDLKLRLLENEDMLFDLGLYVGLGGTVLSLIFLALDIVQASLIAAYASTLFGIIFVAILKVFHVRPYRRLLIVQAERHPLEDESPAAADHL